MKKILAITAAFIAVCTFSGCGYASYGVGNSSESQIDSGDPNKIYTIDELCVRADSEHSFEKYHSNQIFTISGEIDSKTYYGILFKSNIERTRYSKYEIKCEFDDTDTISELSRGDAVTVRGKLDNISLSTLTLKDCVLILSENVENSSADSSDTNQEEIPEPRETAIGKSDKDVDGIMTIKATSVRNDKTGNWRYSAFSESGLNISEYALSYYKEYFESDKEIHAIVNFADKSTTRISCTGEMLYVTVMEYVDGEEHDADLMFSGDIISDYIIYTDNGDIENITAAENSSSQSSEITPDPPQSSTEAAPPVETPQSTTSKNHFNDYSNPEQQNTTEYVLNTGTLKIHFASCNDVKKIAEENYATTTDFDWAISNGYTSCGHCHAR